MTDQLLAAYVVYAFVSSITPGPNNIMLLTSGLNFGILRTVPHMLGVNLGFVAMVMIMGLGLGTLFVRFPMLHTVLKYAGAAYLLYLAWRIANAGAIKAATAGGRPLTFLEAAAFQWINPKAWVMAVTSIATFTRPETVFHDLPVIGLVLLVINLPSILTWVGFGAALQRILSDPVKLRAFNIVMAGLLALTVVPMLRE